MTTISKALAALGIPADGVGYTRILGDSYAGIEWVGEPPVTEADVLAKVAELDADVGPDWDGFAAWAITNAELNPVAATAISNAPLAAAGLPTALLQVQSGNLSNFAATFNAVCTAGGATSQQRNTWADTARDTYHLPADFVAVVRGE